MYYFLPKAANRPVFSYKLSIIHFWSLVFIYIWAGPHHLHYTALPEWASTVGMLFSVMLWMPSWGGMINGLLTLRGAWQKVATDPVLKFFVVGVTFYGMSTFEGPLLSVKSVNGLSHYTDWTIAHVHSGALGWNGMMTFGMLYWLMPRLFQTKLWSVKAASLHFWIATIGILLYIVPIYVAGLTQGLMWRAMDDTGQLVYPDFVETISSIIPMWWLRVIGGALFVSGVVLMAVNHVMTWKTRPATYEEPTYQAPRLSRKVQPEQPQPKSDSERCTGSGCCQEAGRLGQDGLAPTLGTIAGSVHSPDHAGGGDRKFVRDHSDVFDPQQRADHLRPSQPYTPLELAGRDIYVSEGCYNCHSQMIRPMVAETKRYGEYSKAGEFVYDHPFQWGSRRIGPDLAREGGKQSSVWHWLHLENPQAVNEDSVMPSYAHLLDTTIDFNKITDRVWAAHMLGAPYDRELTEAPADGTRASREDRRRYRFARRSGDDC